MATTLSATSVGATGATLNGNVTANGLSTTAWFEWGTDPTMATYSSTSTQAAGSGTTSQSINETLPGLTGNNVFLPGRSEHTSGDSIGEIFSFTTLAPASPSNDDHEHGHIHHDRRRRPQRGCESERYCDRCLVRVWNGSIFVNPRDYRQSAGGLHIYGSSVQRVGIRLISYDMYYFRIVARNAGGTQRGTIKSFPTGEYYVAIGDSITFGQGDDYAPDDTSLDGRNTGGGFEPILNNLLTAGKSIPHNIANEGWRYHVRLRRGQRFLDAVEAPIGKVCSRPVRVERCRHLTLWRADPERLGAESGQAGYDGSYKDNMQRIISAILSASKMPYLAKVPYSTLSRYDIQRIQEYNAVIDGLVIANGISIAPLIFIHGSRLIRANLPMGFTPTEPGISPWPTCG